MLLPPILETNNGILVDRQGWLEFLLRPRGRINDAGDAIAMELGMGDQWLAVDACIAIGKWFELRERRVEESQPTTKRAALAVMVRRSELDQALEELVHLGLCLQPELFPTFVRIPETLGVEVRDALEEQPSEASAP